MRVQKTAIQTAPTIVVLLFIAISATVAAPLVVPVKGEPFAGELVSIDAEGRMTFRPAADPTADAASPGAELRTLEADGLVRWSHPVLPRPQTLVLLDDGSRIVAAAEWSGGAAVRLEGDALVVLSDTFDEVRLPRSQARGLVFAARSHPQARAALEDQVRSSHGEQDQVLLTNQDQLVGNVSELAGGTLTVTTAAGDAKLPLSRIEAVIFRRESAGGSPEARPQPPGVAKLLVGLRDGSLLNVTDARADDARLELQLTGGVRVAGGGVANVASLQSLGGGRFVYLSDLEPADYRHVPYLEIPWPYKRDRNVLGDPLAVGGKRYLKGLGLHSAARTTYRLDGKYRRFVAAAAIDDSAGTRGSVVFGVYLLQNGRWQEAFTSEIIHGGDAPKEVTVNTTGAQGMTLTVDFADRGDELDHADWLDARLVK